MSVTCKWCNRLRGLLPGDVLICSRCDYDHDGATVIPHENRIRDVPEGWLPPWLKRS